MGNTTYDFGTPDYTPSYKAFLKDKTLLITGGSRGIGREIALRAALDGANVAIVAKTATPNPKLPGTIFSVAEEVRSLGGKALALACDIRSDEQIEAAIAKTVSTFGGIDILVNNASAISLSSTESTSMKWYDLMHQINVRGTFAVSRAAIPFLKKSTKNPHILTMSPPISLKGEWFKSHLAYTVSKYGMSMVALGLAEELRDSGIAVNALWPKTMIFTAAMQAIDPSSLPAIRQQSRKPTIVADAAYAILSQPSNLYTGNFAIDEQVLASQGISDLSRYAMVTGNERFLDGRTIVSDLHYIM